MTLYGLNKPLLNLANVTSTDLFTWVCFRACPHVTLVLCFKTIFVGDRSLVRTVLRESVPGDVPMKTVGRNCLVSFCSCSVLFLASRYLAVAHCSVTVPFWNVMELQRVNMVLKSICGHTSIKYQLVCNKFWILTYHSDPPTIRPDGLFE